MFQKSQPRGGSPGRGGFLFSCPYGDEPGSWTRVDCSSFGRWTTTHAVWRLKVGDVLVRRRRRRWRPASDLPDHRPSSQGTNIMGVSHRARGSVPGVLQGGSLVRDVASTCYRAALTKRAGVAIGGRQIGLEPHRPQFSGSAALRRGSGDALLQDRRPSQRALPPPRV
jgi:hypothetical protein